MIQKTIFYFENQVVKVMKTKQAHNVESMKTLKRMQSSHKNSLNNAGVGKQLATCKFRHKPGHVSEQCFIDPKSKTYQGKTPNFKGKMNAELRTSARNAGRLDAWLQNADLEQSAQTAAKPAILPQPARAHPVLTAENITQNQLTTITVLVPVTQVAGRSWATSAG